MPFFLLILLVLNTKSMDTDGVYWAKVSLNAFVIISGFISLIIYISEQKKLSLKDSNATLRRESQNFVIEIRDFIASRQSEYNSFILRPSKTPDEWRANNEMAHDFSERVKDFFNAKYKTRAINIRDRLLSRMSKSYIDDNFADEKSKRLHSINYDNPINNFNYTFIADDIEKMSQLLDVD